MRRDSTKTVRRGLVALVVVVSAAVAWSLLRPAATPPPARPSAEGPAQGTTASDVTFMRFKEGSREISIRARAMLGREAEATKLSGVEVTFPYVAQGRDGNATITADEGLYQPEPLRASFRGNVKVRTDDGLELDSDSLKYWAKEARLFSREAVQFRRGAVSGTATGLDYRAGEGLALQADVKVRIEDGGGPPAEIESGSAHATREEGVVEFFNGVVARQGSRVLHSQRLLLNMTPDLAYVERAAAIEDVDLRSGPGQAVPGAPDAQGGGKRLQCRRLNVAFRSEGVLREAICVNGASLDIEPGPGEPPERRRVTAPQLHFAFDEEGRLSGLQGLPGRLTTARVPKVAVLTADPVPPAATPARRVESERFSANLDPQTGAVLAATFQGGVQFREPGRRASAQRAVYEESTGLVTLRGGEPRVSDEAQGGELRAREIRLGTRSRSVRATDGVRHTIPRRTRTGPPGPLSGEGPTVVLCRRFVYDAQAKRAEYEDNAIMRSGDDEIRAPRIVVEETGEGKRRMSATGGVQSTLHPKTTKKGEEGKPAPVSARSREMVYEEAAGRVVYSGDVEIRQGDILTKSPEAVVVLGKDGSTMERLLAGAPVELHQGTRVARGERATYTPADETLVLVGEKVVLEDKERRLEGRVLTFQAGSDRIRVDGREEVRTEAVFKRQVPPQP
jgi:lipopolysaccharide transport protein LptA/LPS export ABC transporter protein LptC